MSFRSLKSAKFGGEHKMNSTTPLESGPVEIYPRENRTTVTMFRFAKGSFLATLGFGPESLWGSLFSKMSKLQPSPPSEGGELAFSGQKFYPVERLACWWCRAIGYAHGVSGACNLVSYGHP
jgi:hypothetical protein